MHRNATQENLDVLNSFEEYVAKGGDILSFASYYNASNYHHAFEPRKEAIILTLCEEYAIVGNYNKIFQILNTIFYMEKWTRHGFKRFMACIADSELLSPLYNGIQALYENISQ